MLFVYLHLEVGMEGEAFGWAVSFCTCFQS